MLRAKSARERRIAEKHLSAGVTRLVGDSVAFQVVVFVHHVTCHLPVRNSDEVALSRQDVSQVIRQKEQKKRTSLIEQLDQCVNSIVILFSFILTTQQPVLSSSGQRLRGRWSEPRGTVAPDESANGVAASDHECF